MRPGLRSIQRGSGSRSIRLASSAKRAPRTRARSAGRAAIDRRSREAAGALRAVMYPTGNLIAGARLLHGDPVVRVQRAALAVAMMLSSSNVSPMTTIFASLLFAALAGWARAHVWTRAKKTFSLPDGHTLVLAPSLELAHRKPALGQAHGGAPISSESMNAGMQRLWAALACASRMLAINASSRSSATSNIGAPWPGRPSRLPGRKRLTRAGVTLSPFLVSALRPGATHNSLRQGTT